MKTLLIPTLLLSLGLCNADEAKKPAAKPGQAASAKATEVSNLSAKEAQELLDKNKKDVASKKAEAITILDVRTPKEHAEAKMSDSTNIDFRAADFKAQLAKLDKTKPYLVHCRSGGRSTNSLAIFKELGFTKIFHLDGGLDGWKKAGYPVLPAPAP